MLMLTGLLLLAGWALSLLPGVPAASEREDY